MGLERCILLLRLDLKGEEYTDEREKVSMRVKEGAGVGSFLFTGVKYVDTSIPPQWGWEDRQNRHRI